MISAYIQEASRCPFITSSFHFGRGNGGGLTARKHFIPSDSDLSVHTCYQKTRSEHQMLCDYDWIRISPACERAQANTKGLCVSVYVCSLSHVLMPNTLRKIGLIPLKNYTDLPFHLTSSSSFRLCLDSKPLCVSFFHFLVILLHVVQIHFASQWLVSIQSHDR